MHQVSVVSIFLLAEERSLSLGLQDIIETGSDIETRGPCLKLISTTGMSGLEEIFLGSIANNAIHHAHCPVFVIR